MGHGHQRTVNDLSEGQLQLGATGGRWAMICGVVGLIGLGATLLLAMGAEHGREQFFRSYLVSFLFCLSLALGGLFFVLISHLTRAGWNVGLRRIAEVFAWTLLPLAFMAIVVVVGMHELYEWSHAEAVAEDALLQHKSAWLNPTFFIVRLVVYFLVWNLLANLFLGRSLSQDRTAQPKITEQLERIAAPGMIVYALTVTFAAFDLVMSLYPHWYSTIYGVYFFAGSVLAFFAMLPLIVTLLQRAGKLADVVTTEHFHDMGKLMFAFVVFWAYIAFSQYFLIWYGNIPEETVWYELRQSSTWLPLSLVLLFGHFIVPFFALISRHPKRGGLSLTLAALWLLAMHWLDLFYLVMPEGRPEGPMFRLTDFTCMIGLTGIFMATVFWRMSRIPLVALKDPRLSESLGFENV